MKRNREEAAGRVTAEACRPIQVKSNVEEAKVGSCRL